MENQFVNFKIISRNKNGNIYRWWVLGIITFLICFVMIYDEPIPRIVTLIVFCISILLILFFGIKLQLVQEYDEIGWLMLTHSYIVVKLGNDEVEYAIDKATKLSLELRGYNGEPIIGEWIATKKGYDNFISLTNENGTERYEILITNRIKILILNRLLAYYTEHGVIVKYVDQSSMDSKNSIILRLLFAIRQAR